MRVPPLTERYMIKFVSGAVPTFASYKQVTEGGLATSYGYTTNPIALFNTRAEAEFIANGFRDTGTMIVEHLSAGSEVGKGFKVIGEGDGL